MNSKGWLVACLVGSFIGTTIGNVAGRGLINMVYDVPLRNPPAIIQLEESNVEIVVPVEPTPPSVLEEPSVVTEEPTETWPQLRRRLQQR